MSDPVTLGYLVLAGIIVNAAVNLWTARRVAVVHDTVAKVDHALTGGVDVLASEIDRLGKENDALKRKCGSR